MSRLFRVRSLDKVTWMVANTVPGSTTTTTIEATPVLNSELLESNPLQWWRNKPNNVNHVAQPVHSKQWMTPIPTGRPPVLYAIGLNYKTHANETKMELPKFPIVIGKSPTSTIGPNDNICIPQGIVDANEVDYEVELGVVIGTETRNVTPKQALENVLGYTVINDVSARRWQGKNKGGGQWTRAKSFDTFAPIGPCIRLVSTGFDPTNAFLSSRLKKHGSSTFMEMQNDNTRNLIFGVAELISFLSQGTTLPPWTVIATGTPAGVGYTRTPPVFLEPGDEIEVQVDGIGALVNKVV